MAAVVPAVSADDDVVSILQQQIGFALVEAFQYFVDLGEMLVPIEFFEHLFVVFLGVNQAIQHASVKISVGINLV